jgi:predicted cation transporter
MWLLAQLLVYLLALAGIVLGALGMIFFAGGALNQARPREYRVRRAVYAAFSVCGIVASAALGFVGIAAIMYFAR